MDRKKLLWISKRIKSISILLVVIGIINMITGLIGNSSIQLQIGVILIVSSIMICLIMIKIIDKSCKYCHSTDRINHNKICPDCQDTFDSGICPNTMRNLVECLCKVHKIAE